jgi:hypothetical protein
MNMKGRFVVAKVFSVDFKVLDINLSRWNLWNVCKKIMTQNNTYLGAVANFKHHSLPYSQRDIFPTISIVGKIPSATQFNH